MESIIWSYAWNAEIRYRCRMAVKRIIDGESLRLRNFYNFSGMSMKSIVNDEDMILPKSYRLRQVAVKRICRLYVLGSEINGFGCMVVERIIYGKRMVLSKSCYRRRMAVKRITRR